MATGRTIKRISLCKQTEMNETQEGFVVGEGRFCIAPASASSSCNSSLWSQVLIKLIKMCFVKTCALHLLCHQAQIFFFFACCDGTISVLSNEGSKKIPAGEGRGIAALCFCTLTLIPPPPHYHPPPPASLIVCDDTSGKRTLWLCRSQLFRVGQLCLIVVIITRNNILSLPN